MSDKNIVKTSDCENCKNKQICKYTESFATTFNQLNNMSTVADVMTVTLSCGFYQDRSDS